MIITSFVILTLYVLWVSKDGIPESISQSYYGLGNITKSIFTLVIWSAAFLTIKDALILSKNYEWLLFTGISGLLLIGAAPRVNEKFERVIHIIGAILACLGSQIWIILCGNYPISLISWIPLIVYQLIKKDKNIIYWIEILCLSNYYINLI